MKGVVFLVHGNAEERLRLSVSIAAREIGVVPLANIADALLASTTALPVAVAIEPQQLTDERGPRLSKRFADATGAPVRILMLTHVPTVMESDALRRHGATSLVHPLSDARLADNLEVLVESTAPGPAPVVAAGTAPTVLVVDDSETVRLVVSKHLTAAGYRVITASHAANALRIVGSGVKIDAVVSDLLMPGMDGFELKHEIDRTTGGSMPFVLITGEATEENRAIAMRLGSSDFVAKPVQAAALVAALEKLAVRRGG